MVLSIFCSFTAFFVGAVVAAVLMRSRVSGWRFVVPVSLIYIGYFVLLLGLPFWGIPGETLMVLMAGGASWLPMLLGNYLYENSKLKNSPLSRPVLAFLCLPLMAAVLFTLVSRINYAVWLNWKCDGEIIERTRARGNHNAPTLVVDGPSGAVRFEYVDEGLWRQAETRQRLTKVAGSPTALLNGQRIRMVPRELPWGNDPP